MLILAILHPGNKAGILLKSKVKINIISNFAIKVLSKTL